jgi:hypothetical protein
MIIKSKTKFIEWVTEPAPPENQNGIAGDL